MIINDLATIIRNFVENLYSNGVHFYQIILGLFILIVSIKFGAISMFQTLLASLL